MKASHNESYAGALHGMEGVLVRGWAMDLADTAKKVVVELLADGEPIALVSACGCDAALPDHVQGHVFRKLLSASVLRGIDRLTARIANQAVELGPALSPSSDIADDDHVATAWVTNSGGLRIHGVVIQSSRADAAKPRLRVRVDDAWLDWIVADKRDPALMEAGIGDGQRAFDFTLPVRYADGQPHCVRVYASDGSELSGSPFTVLQFPEAPRAWLRSLHLPQRDLAVLDALLERHEQRAPQSLDWSDYPAWKQRFGTSHVPVSTQQVIVAVGPAVGWRYSENSIASLCAQTHDHWRALVWVPSGETIPAVSDSRITFVRANAWAGSLQLALKKAENIASLEMGDTWQPDLLRHALWRLKSGADFSYCDADDHSGGPPWFKPDWCPDTFLQLPLLAHGFVFRARGLKDHLASLSPCPLDWPWQVVCLLGESARAAHIPHPLHSRGDGQPASASRPVLPMPGRPDIADLVKHRFGVVWQAALGDGPHLIQWPDPADWPKVGLIVPTRDALSLLKPCIDSLLQTDYEYLSICVVDNQSTDPATLDYLAHLETAGLQVLRWPHPFNFSSINNFAVAAMGAIGADVVGLINNDVRAQDAGWLKRMVRQLMRPGVAAVGAKLLWPNRMVQHAGVVLGLHGLAGHIGNQWMDSDAGYHHVAHITRTVSAVTAACLLVRRDDYLAVGGMNEWAFPVNFNDVDFCLRLGKNIGRVVMTPEAVLEHAESASRGRDNTPEKIARLSMEKNNLLQRWSSVISNDPYYNQNLNLDRYSFNSLAFPPRGRES